MSDRKIKWYSCGNLPELADCETEQELSDELDAYMRQISEDMGEVVYQADGKTYVVGLVLSVMGIEEEQTEDILN